MVLIGLLQKLVSLKTLSAIHETSKHMSGFWVNLEMLKDFSILSNRVALAQIFHLSWHLEPIPDAIYDEITCPESQLGELGQLWVLACITEDKVGCITVDKVDCITMDRMGCLILDEISNYLWRIEILAQKCVWITKNLSFLPLKWLEKCWNKCLHRNGDYSKLTRSTYFMPYTIGKRRVIAFQRCAAIWWRIFFHIMHLALIGDLNIKLMGKI